MRTAPVALAAALALTGCGTGTGPELSQADGASIVTRIVKERALAYPDAEVSGLAVSQNGMFVCGIVRSDHHRPYVFKGFQHDGKWAVVGPLLVREGSWENPVNQTRSERNEEDCRQVGAPVSINQVAGGGS